jgi:hypothetical protein
MQVHDRRLLYTEVAAAIVSAALFVLTLVDPQWIETLFDEAPDGGDGSLERGLLLGSTALATLVAALLAWREKRRLPAAPQTR